jgi:hypothetical protein
VRIGVGGHRGLPADTAKLVAEACMTPWGPRKSGGLIGVSILAYGGAQLLVETILALGGRLEVFVSADYYRDGVPADCPATHLDVVKQATELQRLAFAESTGDVLLAGSMAMLDAVDALAGVGLIVVR